MTAMILTVLTASLLGSVHCAGMCGPFCGVAVGGSNGRRGAVSTHACYHLGRLITYLAMGAAAGALGSLLNLASTLAGLQPIALAAAGGVMVAIGLIELAKLGSFRLPGQNVRPPKVLTRLLQSCQRRAAKLSGSPRALAIGLLTTLLPCGWLYAFVITAAGTGSPSLAMLVMTAFWAGTLPVMLALGVGVRELAGRLGDRLPVVTAVALVVVGVVTLSGRSTLSASELTASAIASAEQSNSEVPEPGELPPCCQAERESP